MPEPAKQRRDQVLAVAERLFAERGFQATSVRDIADALKIRGGSLYAHIESKEELLWEIVSYAANRFFEVVDRIIATDLVNIEKLRRVIAAHVEVITSDLHAATVYQNEWRNLSEPRRTQFVEMRDRYEQIIRGLVHECMREGTFAAVDEKFATLLILSSINWIYQWYKPDGMMTSEEIARRLTDLLFHGLKRAGS